MLEERQKGNILNKKMRKHARSKCARLKAHLLRACFRIEI